MKITLSSEEFTQLLRELRYVKSNVAPPIESEADYAAMVSRKWGSLPPDMELDASGNPVVKADPVPPDFSGVVPGGVK